MSRFPRIIMLVLLFIIQVLPIAADSLYSKATYTGLIGDKKAFRVGDSLTILVVENSTASTTTGLSTSEDFDVSAFAGDNAKESKLGVNGGVQYDNGGKVARTGKLLARVTVTVHEVLSTGELRVQGKQEIIINEERQFISVEGNIRPDDIDNNNVAISTRLANSKIIYDGDGVVGGKPGVITQFFKWLF